MKLMLSDGYVDLEEARVVRTGNAQLLTATEVRLLRYLAERPDPVPLELLRRDVWRQRGLTSGPRNAIRRLRTKIEVDRARPTHLKYVAKRGYTLELNESPSSRTELSDGVIDWSSRQVVRDGRAPQALTPIECRLLQFLASQAGPVSVQQLLESVWGYSPDVRSRAAYVAVQRLRQKIEVTPSAPRHLVTVRGHGYTWHGVDDPLIAGVGPDFVGRRTELREIVSAFDEGWRLVTLVGPGGVGKTRLATEFASSRSAPFVLVDLTGAHDEPTLWHAIARQIELTLQGDEAEQQRRLRFALASRPGWVVLDNADDCVEPLRALVEPLHTPPVARWLVTSREALDCARERVIEVSALPTEEAIELLVRSAQRASRTRWSPLDEEASAMASLARQVDRMPLGLEIAGSFLPMFGPEPLVQRLRGGLTLQGRSTMGRFTSLQDATRWSLDRLPGGLEQALAQASVAHRALTAEMAEHVVVIGVPSHVALAELRRRSLLQTDPASGGLRMLAIVRRVVLERAATEVRQAARRRHLDFCVEVARGLAAEDPCEATLRRFVRYRDDAVLALELALEIDDRSAMVDLVHALTELGRRTFRMRDVRPLVEQVRDRVRPGTPGWAMVEEHLAYDQPNCPAVQQRLLDALPHAANDHERAWILKALMIWAFHWEAAIPGGWHAYAEQGVRLRNVPPALAAAFRLADFLRRAEDPSADVESLFEEWEVHALDTHPYPTVHMRCLLSRSFHEAAHRRPAKALATLEQARTYGSKRGFSQLFFANHAGLLAWAAGDLRAGLDALPDMLEYHRRAGNEYHFHLTRHRIARLSLLNGRDPRDSLRVLDELPRGLPADLAFFASMIRGECMLALGQGSRARAHFLAALDNVPDGPWVPKAVAQIEWHLRRLESDGLRDPPGDHPAEVRALRRLHRARFCA